MGSLGVLLGGGCALAETPAVAPPWRDTGNLGGDPFGAPEAAFVVETVSGTDPPTAGSDSAPVVTGNLSGLRLRLLVNFGAPMLKDGFEPLVNGLDEQDRAEDAESAERPPSGPAPARPD